MIKKIPNILSIFRLACVPVFAYLLIMDEQNWALLVFVIASLTDLVDGYLARRLDAMTDFGSFVDPLADRLLVDTALIILVWQDLLPALVLVILIRDVVMAFGYLILRKKLKIAPTRTGKWSSAMMMAAIAITLFGFETFGKALAAVGLFLAFTAFFQYFKRGLRHRGNRDPQSQKQSQDSASP